MNACRGHWWCHTCDEPAQSGCRKSKHHRTEWILDAPVRDRAVLSKEHQAAHTHQFAPTSVTLDPERAHEWFAQMRRQAAGGE